MLRDFRKDGHGALLLPTIMLTMLLAAGCGSDDPPSQGELLDQLKSVKTEAEAESALGAYYGAGEAKVGECVVDSLREGSIDLVELANVIASAEAGEASLTPKQATAFAAAIQQCRGDSN